MDAAHPVTHSWSPPVMAVLAPVLALFGQDLGGGPTGTAPRVEYSVRYDPGPERDPARLAVVLTASGMERSAAEVVVELRDWGEWTGASFPYLSNLHVDGQLREGVERGTLRVDPDKLDDGRLEVRYELAVHELGSPEHDERPLLPYRADGFLFAFLANTLAGLTQGGEPIVDDVTVTLSTSSDRSVVTGWAGDSPAGAQTARAPNPATSNGLFAIGVPRASTSRAVGGSRIEVVQLVAGPDATRAVAGVAAAVVPSFARAAGRPAPDAIRILLDARSGGTQTDAGVRVGMRDTRSVSPAMKELIAHELFHIWLGRYLMEEEAEALVWFKEGFTDYVALWHCAAAGVTSPDRFAERLLAIERQARTRSSLGRVAFADAGIDWRDGDGPNETMAYKGGALLAFVLDVRLREKGRGTVAALVRELSETVDREYRLEHIRECMLRLGLEEAYAESVAGTHVPEAAPLLDAMGFEETTLPKALTYLGIEARSDGSSDSTGSIPATVTGIDPDGPAAGSGLELGDRIFGYEPVRTQPPELSSEAPSRYRWGLNVIASGAETAYLDVVRGSSEIRFEVAPRLVPGGTVVALRWNRAEGSGFFELPE